jgi:hypothetical protein
MTYNSANATEAVDSSLRNDVRLTVLPLGRLQSRITLTTMVECGFW